MRVLYEPDGDGFVATPLTQGGWHPEHQHGGTVQGLLARCIETVPTLVPMQVTRMTFDMVRPVPIGPRLDVATRITREGKKIQVVEVTLRVGDVDHVRCTALRLRIEDVSARPTVPAATAPDRRLPPPEGFEPVYRDLPHRPGFLQAMDMRRFPAPGAPEGVFGYWIRLEVPVVAGEDTSPLSRLGVAGDFANTIGVMVESASFSTINPDVNVHVLRLPVGEWTAVIGDTRFRHDAGFGVSIAEVHDLDGLCAVASTSQLLQLR